MKTFTYNIFINTSAPKLWEALISPEFSRQYWAGREIRSEWKVGAPIALIRQDGTVNWKGTVLSYDTYTTLSFTFDVSDYSPLASEPISKVTYKLTPSGEAIMLTILHEELTEAVEKVISSGWPRICSSLKSLLETGKPLATPDV